MVTSGPDPVRARRRSGFSLAELVVAVVILSYGILTMAGTATWVIRQITVSKLTTERSVARQSAIEGVMTGPFSEVAGGGGIYGRFDVTWNVCSSPVSVTCPTLALTANSSGSRTLRVITVGLGRTRGTSGITYLSEEAADTVFMTRASPGF